MMIPPRTPRQRAPKWVGSDGGQPLVRFFSDPQTERGGHVYVCDPAKKFWFMEAATAP